MRVANGLKAMARTIRHQSNTFLRNTQVSLDGLSGAARWHNDSLSAASHGGLHPAKKLAITQGHALGIVTIDEVMNGQHKWTGDGCGRGASQTMEKSDFI